MRHFLNEQYVDIHVYATYSISRFFSFLGSFDKNKATNPGKINRPEKNPLDTKTTYHIGNRSFVVEPVFKKERPDTLGSVLLRLMKSESEKL